MRLFTSVVQETFVGSWSAELNVSVSSNQNPISSIRMYDVTGRLSKEITGVNSFAKTVEVSGMTTGIYLISIKLTDGATATRKVAIEK